MTVDIGGYYGAIKNPYKNGRVLCFPYYNYYNKPETDTLTIKPSPKKEIKNSKLSAIIISTVSLIGLIAGALVLRKPAGKLIKKLKYKKLRLYAGIKRLFRKKKTDKENVKKGFFSKIKGWFHKEKAKTDSAKKESFFKRIFRRKPKVEETEPPKVNPNEIFKGKSKARTIQRDRFFKRLFRMKPISGAPPKAALDIIEGRTKLPKFSSARLKLMDLGCKTCIFLRKYFPF